MKEPYRYTGPDIIYPEATLFSAKEGLVIDGYLPGVLKRGLRNVALLNSWVRRGTDVLPAAPGNSLIFQKSTKEGLATRLGLNELSTDDIHRAAVVLAQEITREGLEEADEKFRIGMLGYLAISEAQSFNAANKRTARAVFGRSRYGHGAHNIKRGVDAIIDDTVPQEVERLILLQNIVRFDKHHDIAAHDFGGMFVDSSIEMRLEQQREILDCYRFADKTTSTAKDLRSNTRQLINRLAPLLPGSNLAGLTAGVLMQETYGPAAWMLCCEDMPVEDITPYIAEEIISTNKTLLQLRITSLLNIVANGGKLVDIVDSAAEGKEREVKIIEWMPRERSVLSEE